MSSLAPPHGENRSSRQPLLLLILWGALATGIGEWLLRLVAREVLATPVFLNPASLWLGPLSAGIYLAPITAGAWAVGRLRGPAYPWPTAVGAAVFVICLDLLLLVPRVHGGALLLLAAGVGSVATRVAVARQALVGKAIRASSLVLVVILVVGGIASAGGESRVPSTPAPPLTRGPSVLLLILDTVRAMELSAYGYQRATSPHLAQLAAEGVRFDLAVAPAPWTLPTHASLFTGLFQRDLSVGWTTPLDSTPATLAEYFRDRGYRTGGFVANLRYVSREHGLDRGFEEYRDYAVTPSQLIGSTMLGRLAIARYNDWFDQHVVTGRKDAALVVDEFLEWRRRESDGRYFAFLNLFDAHDPYTPDSPYDMLFQSGESTLRSIEFGRRHSAPEIRDLRDSYDGAIAQLDSELSRLFTTLEEEGSLDSTLVIVTSDHGEEFGEHGHLAHGNGLHLPALHVPLLVRWPAGSVPAGVVVDDPVSLVDVPATIIDLVGGPGDATIPGVSLAPLWDGQPLPTRSPGLSELYWVANQPDWYPVASGDMSSLVRGRFHFIAGPGEHEELYDILADPLELRDLAGQPEWADTTAALRAALARFPLSPRGGR